MSDPLDYPGLARQVVERCRKIASFTDDPGVTTRTFLGQAAKSCHRYLSNWMNRIGMDVETDAVGNLRGLYAGSTSAGKRLLIGSHLDTVPNAGAFDGVLGVVIGIALVEALGGERLPFAVEVIGFSDEEGVRFGVPFLGSRALAGSLDEDTLALKDRENLSVKQAIRAFGLDPSELGKAALTTAAGAYLEFHIEQGPVLESLRLPLGVVTVIAGQSRVLAIFRGKAAHAGTTPMPVRQDALCAAAEWITLVEREARGTDGLVATVGAIQTRPGVANVVPGEVSATLDVRHFSDEIRRRATARLLESAQTIVCQRGVGCEFETLIDQRAVPMNETLTRMAEAALQSTGTVPHRMTSGAGHDAMILAPRLPSAMIFLRSPGGVSHHPDETVQEEDVAIALRAGSQLLQDFRKCPFLI